MLALLGPSPAVSALGRVSVRHLQFLLEYPPVLSALNI
jgi:hypothetical protein